MGELLHPVAFDRSRDSYVEPRPAFAGAGVPAASALASVAVVHRATNHQANAQHASHSASPGSFGSAKRTPPIPALHGDSTSDYPAQSHPAQSYPAQSYPAHGYPAQGHPAQSYYPTQGSSLHAHPAQGYPAQGHPAQGHPAQSYPAQGHPAQGYPAQGYPAQSYPAQSYPAQSYPAQSYPARPAQGYPAREFSRESSPTQGQPTPSGPAEGPPLNGAWSPETEQAPINRVLHFGQASASSRYEDDPSRSGRCVHLVLCVGGTARYQCGNQTQQIRAGTIAWSVPELRFQFVDSSPDYDAWIAIVDATLVRQLGLAVDRRQGAGLSRRLTKVSARRLQTQFEHLSGVAPGSDQFTVGLEYLILSAWAEQHRATRVDELTDVHPAVEKAAHILRTQPETGSLRELAGTCGASASWLSRLFREQLGVSLVGYRNQSRIERFFELYGEGRRRNLTQAALAAGFGSYAQFHRVFKDTLGFAPGDLKRGARVAAESDEPIDN